MVMCPRNKHAVGVHMRLSKSCTAPIMAYSQYCCNSYGFRNQNLPNFVKKLMLLINIPNRFYIFYLSVVFLWFCRYQHYAMLILIIFLSF